MYAFEYRCKEKCCRSKNIDSYGKRIEMKCGPDALCNKKTVCSFLFCQTLTVIPVHAGIHSMFRITMCGPGAGDCHLTPPRFFPGLQYALKESGFHSLFRGVFVNCPLGGGGPAARPGPMQSGPGRARRTSVIYCRAVSRPSLLRLASTGFAHSEHLPCHVMSYE